MTTRAPEKLVGLCLFFLLLLLLPSLLRSSLSDCVDYNDNHNNKKTKKQKNKKIKIETKIRKRGEMLYDVSYRRRCAKCASELMSELSDFDDTGCGLPLPVPH